MRFFVKILLSVWIIYHLLVIVVMPNNSSFAKRYVGDFFSIYANHLMINVPWDMFAPNPPKSIHIKYTIRFPKETGKRGIHRTVPNEEHLGFHPNRIREFYLMIHASANSDRMKKKLLTWLCRKYPGAEKVKAQLTMTDVRSLDQVIIGDGSAESLLNRKESPPVRAYCNEVEGILHDKN